MPTLNDVLAGSLAQAVQVQQIIDALKGTPSKGVPISLVSLSDSTNYALTVQNDDVTNSRALLVLKADGTTLIEADATGVTLGSPVNLPSGSINGGTALADGSVTNQKLGPDVARANLLTNGGFEIWQRGNGPFTANGAYTADRWSIGLAGTDTLSVSMDGANVDPNSGSIHAAVCTFTKGSGANTSLGNTLKPSDGAQVRGRTLSASLRVRTSTVSAVSLALGSDGTGGSAISVGTVHTGDGTWQTLTKTYSVPADATYLGMYVLFNASCTAYIDNAMLVTGSQPADYAPLHPADDLARCLRYYETAAFSSNAYIASGQVYGATSVVYMTQYTPKAVTPTVTYSAPATFAVTNASFGLVTPTTVTSNSNLGTRLGIAAIVASGLVSGNASTLIANSGQTASISLEANP